MASHSRNIILLGIALVLTRCTGSLPTSGTLPKIDGSAVSNVNATSIGGIPASSITTMMTSVSGASAKNSVTTLVSRDESGNFSAGTITATLNGSATYALGRKGNNLASATMLALGDDGNYFDVTGALPIQGMTAKAAGSRVTLRFVDGALLVSSATFSLQGGPTSQFVTAPNDVFEFLSTSDGWLELSRKTTNESEIHARRAGALTINTTAANIAFDTVMTDHQGEYAGGQFTAKQDGLYLIDANFVTQGMTAGDSCQLTIANMSLAVGKTCVCAVSTTGFGCPIECSASIRFLKGQVGAAAAICTAAVSINVGAQTFATLNLRRIGD